MVIENVYLFMRNFSTVLKFDFTLCITYTSISHLTPIPHRHLNYLFALKLYKKSLIVCYDFSQISIDNYEES